MQFKLRLKYHNFIANFSIFPEKKFGKRGCKEWNVRKGRKVRTRSMYGRKRRNRGKDVRKEGKDS